MITKNKLYLKSIFLRTELKELVLALLFLVVSFPMLAQVTGDYRSKATGNWSSASTWQIYNGTSWVNATSYPGQNSNVSTVTIGSGNTVTLNVDITSYTIDKLIIGDQSGGDDTLSLPDNGDFDVNIMIVSVQSDGILSWVKNADLHLPEGAQIYNNGGEITTDKNCNASQNIYIGSNKFSNCNGNGGSDYSFDEVESALPPPTSDGDITECAEDPIQTLTASATPPSGAYVVWYTASSGGSSVSPTLNTVGNVTYYAESVDNSDSSRRSLFRTAVELTILSRPTISVSSSPSCVFALFSPTTYELEVTVSSGTVTSTAGTVTNTSGNVWEITDVPDETDIVVTVTDANGCSEDLPISAPNCSCPVVDAPTSDGDRSFCTGDSVPSISASVGFNETVDWYDAASGGTLLLLNNTTYTPSGPGTFYAEARNNTTNCVSGSRTAITVTEDTPSTATIGPDQTIFTGGNAIFTVTATNADTYQWQLSTDGGTVFNDISDGAEYTGTQSTALTVQSAGVDKNGYKYRVLASKSGSSCPATPSSSALLTVKVKTVIMNRRITYRVNPS
ncbi:immunoglobulin domain-containing protein [Maribacter polysaccharolyticus]|uniref:immunoglobulin domain-containing protein n=1 Tax=Maribacter polysaccharolyticus TaxID=3020831 RepID=UPI00237F092D|nr:hypothetical protein [Maribacter polysaccharolyticus]MDE3743985.1 hypothetical protein [Maribacter polysaccharolyticus]